MSWSIRVRSTTPEEIGFTGCWQLAEITRKRNQKTETIVYLCSKTATEITPSEILKVVRDHWKIENKIHHRRDRTFDEDRHQLKHRKGAAMMSALRNLSIFLYERSQESLPKNIRSFPCWQKSIRPTNAARYFFKK